jgi:hypothetical protein
VNVTRRLPPLDHLIALTDDTGIVQHATYDVPNRSTGYCTDDVARAFMVAVAASKFDGRRDAAIRLARVYLAFLMDAQLPDGRFHNFMSYQRDWLDEVGTDDSIGRAIWSLGFGMRHAPRSEWRAVCRQLLEAALPNVGSLGFIRSRAYAALGLANAHESLDVRVPALDAELLAIGNDLAARHAATVRPGWDWFEHEMTYDNARLPEALFRIGMALDNSAFIELGRRTFDFYLEVVIVNGTFVPIGNEGWYLRQGGRALHAQQPLEAASLVDAALVAAAATGDGRYKKYADLGLDWFYGRNTGNAVLAIGGGCCDGLEAHGANANMGAESTLAYLASAFSLASSRSEAIRVAR